MHWLLKLALAFVAVAALALIASFWLRARVSLRAGPPAAAMARCPQRPNCVSSDASDERHRVAPLELAVDPATAWEAVGEVLGDLPRVTPVDVTERYLRAECRSSVFGFVDDLELELRSEEGAIAVRSASRVGVSDLGVNRRRVEALRAALAERGIVR